MDCNSPHMLFSICPSQEEGEWKNIVQQSSRAPEGSGGTSCQTVASLRSFGTMFSRDCPERCGQTHRKQRFQSSLLIAAMDRLLHHAHTVVMEGHSYRNPPEARKAS